MKIGLIAQDCNTGIGHQTWEFARAMNPHKVLVTDLNDIHRASGKKVKNYPERFEAYDTRTVRPFGINEGIEWLLDGIDVLFVVETPINWDIFRLAKEKGIKTVLQYNHEFLEYFVHPEYPRPDLFLAPSRWNMEEVKQFGKVEHLPVPIATDRFEGKPKKTAHRFLHIAGHKTFEDRNGTEVVLTAIEMGSDITVRSQHEGDRYEANEVENYWELYEGYDVLVFPRAYGGLSLQLQEACAAGLVPLIGECDPYAAMVGYKLSQYVGDTIVTRGQIQTHRVYPSALHEAYRELKEQDIRQLSELSLAFADAISWKAMKPRYQKLLSDLCA